MKSVFIFLSLFIIGCQDHVQLYLDDEVRETTDLEKFIQELSNKNTTGGSLETVSLEGEKIGDNNEVPGETVAEAQMEGKPEYVEKLHKKIDPGKTGKKNLKRKRKQIASGTDLVGENPPVVSQSEEPNKQMEEEGELIVDVITPNLDADVLFVMDNSGSMGPFLRPASIYEKFIGFTTPLTESELNWRMAFISADVKNKKYKSLMPLEINGNLVNNHKYIGKDMDRSYQVLLDTLIRQGSGSERCSKPPYCGGRREMPLGALEKFLKSPKQDFLRKEAELVVIILTDNYENRSKNEEITLPSKVIQTLYEYHGEDKKMRVYSISVEDESCKQEIRGKQIFSEGNYSRLVGELVNETGGAKFSLCDPSYVSLSQQIVEDQLTVEL